MSKSEKPEECESCGFETKQLDYYGSYNGTGHWDCDLCSGTMTGTWTHSGTRLHDQEIEIMKTICYVGNVILKELRKRKS